MNQTDVTYRTLYAELEQRSLDASFDAAFPATGNFVRVPVKGRDYWYFEDRYAEKKRRYVGPAADPEIARRVEEFGRVKEQFRGRRRLVSTLVREARFTAPDRLTGDIVEALENAGLFRLRAVLIGTIAFQTYSAYLGIRLPGAIVQTGDADFAQFHSIANEVEDEIPSILDVLKSVDPSFRPIPHRGDGRYTSQYINGTSYLVEFLTPNRGSDDYADKPALMPALGDTAAQPMRFMDFLIREPVRAIMLHGDGIPVLVPAPERYAVHKLIVASQRLTAATGIAKREKDLRQSRQLFEALAVARMDRELADAFVEAWERGPAWQEAIRGGIGYLQTADAEVVRESLEKGLDRIGRRYREFFPPTPAA
jgi:hypothetical protein